MNEPVGKTQPHHGPTPRPDPWRTRAWRAASIGLCVAIVAVAGMAGAFFWASQSVFLGVLGGLLLGAAGLGLFAGLTRLFFALSRRLPPVFLAVVGGVVGTLFLLKEINFGFPDLLFYPGLLLFITTQALLWGLGTALFSHGFKEARPSHKVGGVGLFLLALAVTVGGVLWLADDGQDSYPVEVAAEAPVSSPALPNPAEPGRFSVQTLTYGSGTDRRRAVFGEDADLATEPVDASLLLPEWKGFKKRMREWYWGFGIEEAPLNGRVWLPEGDGPFPLVLVVHGNHRMEEHSDPGYAYLGALFASRGYITVSVDENFINGTWSGDFRGKEMPVRAWLLLQHLAQWRTWNATPGHRFFQRVDMDNLALIGHSRGGEAVAMAAAFNPLPAYPDDAQVTFDFDFSIKAIVAIAPTDKRYHRRVKIEDVSYLTLQGSYDSDESSFEGIRQYQRTSFSGEAYRFKAGVYIHGANHGQFNTVWGRTDAGPPRSWLLNLEPLLTGEAQRQVGAVFMSAFLEATLKGQTGYVPLFKDHRAGAAWLPPARYVQRFEDTQYRFVADFDEDLNVETTTLAEGRIEGAHLSRWREEDLPFRGESGRQGNQAVYLGWQQGAEGTPSYTLTLPDDYAPAETLTPDARLVFALAGTKEDPVPATEEAEEPPPEEEREAAQPLDLTIALVDSTGAAARLSLRPYRLLQPPLEVQFLKVEAVSKEAYGDTWEPVLQTYELPLADFVKANPALDLTILQAIRFVFDQSEEGVLILDEVGFRRPLQSTQERN